VKISPSGARQYVKLVEAFRDTAGTSRQHVIATLGRLEAVLYRVLRMRLKAKGNPNSPEHAPGIVRRNQYHQITLRRHHTAAGLSALSQEQKELFAAVPYPRPPTRCVRVRRLGVSNHGLA
jgi:hypothetical protein